MQEYQSNSKRIAKNTLFLYFRQIITMVVSLYTSRVVLNTLGVEDYGIYNVVGGIVLMFSFLTSTMASASQRYLSYDISKGDDNRLKQTFSLIMLFYFIMSFIIFGLAETLAVWVLNNKINIPEGRLVAANWVLQSSITTFVISLLSTPYLSVIIARERMEIYAYASIIEVVLKLLIVYALHISKVDKLILYSVLMLGSSSSIVLFYMYFCKKHFKESAYSFYFDKKRFLEMSRFASWNIIGAVSNVLRIHGINILLNIFFNPSINAARAIAYQVSSAVNNFSNNFYTAIRPQIIKKYSQGEVDNMLSLVFNSSKFAYFLLFLITVPFFFETAPILSLWLKTPPDYTTLFVQLVLASSLLEVLSYPLVNSLQATGKIKSYQIVVSVCYLMNLPLSYTALKMDFPPESTMIINIILVILCFFPRLVICKKNVGLSITEYFRKVVFRIVSVSFISFVSSSMIVRLICTEDTTVGFLIRSSMMLFSTALIIFFIGLNRRERNESMAFIKLKLTPNGN